MMNLTTMALAFLILGMAPGAQPEPPEAPELATATFAGGCFWCMEPPFGRVGRGRVDDVRLHRRASRQS